jgi:acyl dehydratase
MRGKTMDGLELGQKAVIVKTITAADIEQYSTLTGDRNPLHTDHAFAKRTRFGEPIAQGMLAASVISACIGSRLPGPGDTHLSKGCFRLGCGAAVPSRAAHSLTLSPRPTFLPLFIHGVFVSFLASKAPALTGCT